MRKVIISLAALMVVASAGLAQTGRRPAAPAGTLKPGYYFTLDMCRACYYPDWKEDTIRLFKEARMPAQISEGTDLESAQAFAPLRAPARRGFYSDVVYVGPFASAAVATTALEKFPPVLSAIQKKRNSLEEGGQGWPIDESEKVKRTRGNDYVYGFYFIKGYRVIP